MNVARGTAFNLVGLVAPLPLALAAIPALVSGLGDGRFGLLTLFWAVTAYMGLFDLGLGRALTLHLSIALERGETGRVAQLCRIALCAMGLLGLLGGAVLWLAAPALAGLIRGLPDAAEAVACLRLIGLVVPVIVLTAGLRGILEACRAFDLVNYLRVPLGLWTFAGPWLQVTLRPPDLVEITVLLVSGRVLACLAHVWLAPRRLPVSQNSQRSQVGVLSELLRSGGWLTVSNLVGPLMGYADRFVLGAVLSAAAVAYYATPQEITSKLWILPGAVTMTLFPTLAARIATGDARTSALCRQALRWLILALLPLTLGLALFARELLGFWLGARFGAHSAFALQAFAMGMFAGGLAQLPFTILQSAGRAASTALVHVIELPFFLVALVWGGGRFGVEGAALVWFVRCALDAVAMFWLAARGVRPAGAPLFDHSTAAEPMLASAAFLGLLLPAAGPRIAWFAGVCMLVLVVALRQLRLHR